MLQIDRVAATMQRRGRYQDQTSRFGHFYRKEEAMDGLTRYLPLIGRLLIAAIFILSGYNKIMNPEGTQAYINAAGLPLPFIAYIIAVVVELGGGILLVVGYQTRLVALALAIFTLAAAFGFHHNFGDQNQFVHFFKNLAMAGGLLQIVAFGAGALSVDASRGGASAGSLRAA
jgi:putative oxidoreductase